LCPVSGRRSVRVRPFVWTVSGHFSPLERSAMSGVWFAAPRWRGALFGLPARTAFFSFLSERGGVRGRAPGVFDSI
jgi:hypothetical protein